MTKIRVVWNNGTEQIFEGYLDWYSKNLWRIKRSEKTKEIFIPAYQMRYFEIVEE